MLMLTFIASFNQSSANPNFQTFVANGGKNTPGKSRLSRWDGNKIPTATPFSITTIPIELSVKLSDVTGSAKSKMATSKLPKMYISASTQDINEIPTAIPMFLGSNYQMRIVAMLYDQMGRNRKRKIQDGGH